MNVKKVTVIPANIKDELTVDDLFSYKKRKVAAYARVSTEQDEEANSYEAQISYYSEYIQDNPKWEFVKVYTDEGLSGLMTKKREGFNSMISDALSGKIDLILTKSVSRFARNTVDTLTTVRQLKEKGVEVYFEKENIYTLDSKGELMITIMSSLAQEESRSISENVTWGHRKNFADGKVYMSYRSFLGYRKGMDGKPEIIPEEAEIVKRIYREFLQGKTYRGIADGLSADGFITPKGNQIWSASTIQSILSNEKYKGDALLQKRFTVDFLTKTQKINEGEVPQYYVTNSHPAIVSDEVFTMAQHERERRKSKKVYGSAKYFFSGRIFCGSCGEVFTRKIWHSNSKYKRYIWQCGKKYAGKEPCTTAHFSEDEIKTGFEKLLADIIKNKDEVVDVCKTTITRVLDTSEDKKRAENFEVELKELYDELLEKIKNKARRPGDTKEERAAIVAVMERYEEKSKNLEKLEQRIADKKKRLFDCKRYMESIRSLHNDCENFSERLWISLVDHVSVPESGKKALVFYLRGNREVKIEVPIVFAN